MHDDAFAPALNGATAGGSLSFAAYVELAQRTGYRWIELDRSHVRSMLAFGPARAADLLRTAGLQVASFFLPVAWRAGDTAFAADMAALPAIAAAANAVGATRCGIWLLPNFPTPADETRRQVTPRLQAMASRLADHGLGLGLEFIGPAHLRAEPGFTFLYRMEDMLAFAMSLGENVGILIDSLHWHCLDGTALALAAIPAGRIVHVHVNDVPPGERKGQRDDDRRLPGDGVLDLTGFIDGLRRAGYRRPVGIEVDGPALRALDDETAALKARLAWQRVLAAAKP